MTDIGPISPAQPPFESEKTADQVKKKASSEAQADIASNKSSHRQKLQRFAKVYGSAEVERKKVTLESLGDVNSPIRNQWNNNNGYCGETSLIAAGLMNGQYFSQYTAREMAGTDPNNAENFEGFDPTMPQTTCQLLLGDNDQYTATQMGLNSEAPTSAQASSGTAFLNWVRTEIAKGCPVMMGVYENRSIFGQADEQPEYDHIVTVTNITGTDITFHDNGLYDGPPKDTFTIPLSQFLQSRHSADKQSSPVYSLCQGGPCFGLAITGINDPNRETLPVSLAADPNDEPNEIAEGSNDAPSPTPVNLTPTISGLTVGQQYVIYQYNDPSTVPATNINASSQAAVPYPPPAGYRGITKLVFTATSSSMTLPARAIQSSDTAIFRCVPLNGP